MIRRLPWWHRPAADPEPVVHGEPGPGRVLVVTMYDVDGEPIESAWVDERVAWQYDDTRWTRDPNVGGLF